ncbi:MAG: rhomboid family intramembrane serine protease [Clostridiales bacterium]|nr:rhomboid family intramembrane serine protease [Clostridiales bacterium]
MTEQLDLYLRGMGFECIPSNLPEFRVYFQIESTFVNVIHVIDYKEGIYLPGDQYEHIREKVRELFVQRGIQEMHMLSLILSGDLQKARVFCQNDRFCWFLDTKNRRLVVDENQTPDFYGMRGKLEEWITQVQTRAEGTTIQQPDQVQRGWKNIPVVTSALILINVIVYLICTFQGELLYNEGALSAERIFKYGEYYRIFTSWFLHSNAEHLFNNMLLLYFFGEMVEQRLGRLRFGILYVAAGFGGSFCSLYYMIAAKQSYVSVGASGAVFGVEGALLMLVLLNRGRLRTVTFGRLAFIILYSIYIGFRSTYVDNFAHIGGVITGFLVCLILYLTRRKAENT